MNDKYKNGKIYKIISPTCDKVYYGSTMDSLNARFSNHKSEYKKYLNKKTNSRSTSYNIVKNENAYIKLVEYYPCKSRRELEKREQYYIDNYTCINKANSQCKSKYVKNNKKYDYSKGKIYKIISPTCDKVYFGSTIQTLNNRLSLHKYRHKNNMNSSSSEILKYSDYSIELVENYPCNTKDELNEKEQYYIDNFPCVNKVNAKKNLEKYTKIKKEYDLKKSKEKIKCECGAITTKKKLHEHKKTKKHLDIINNNIKILTEDEINAKNHRKEIDKKFYEKNKENLKEKRKKKIQCDCGSEISKRHLYEHIKTQRHQAFEKTKKKCKIIDINEEVGYVNVIDENGKEINCLKFSNNKQLSNNIINQFKSKNNIFIYAFSFKNEILLGNNFLEKS